MFDALYFWYHDVIRRRWINRRSQRLASLAAAAEDWKAGKLTDGAFCMIASHYACPQRFTRPQLRELRKWGREEIAHRFHEEPK